MNSNALAEDSRATNISISFPSINRLNKPSWKRDDFEGIVGRGRSLWRVLQLVETVAAGHSTVLLLGETGTGKELVAKAIHNRSCRRERAFVKLNCAAIPSGLLESEFFGHERGAFTGAVTQKIGRLELADQGSLFLDEIGDIPLELQPKLLRELQEQEFERLGSTRTKKVNVRIVAATHRDLEGMVLEKQFRSDLYYRLNGRPGRYAGELIRASWRSMRLSASRFVGSSFLLPSTTARRMRFSAPSASMKLSRYRPTQLFPIQRTLPF